MVIYKEVIILKPVSQNREVTQEVGYILVLHRWASKQNKNKN